MTYDSFGRLSSAVYLEEGVANQHYDEAFTYDKMGNVQGIVRYGLQDNSQYGLIDNVSLYYNGNQMVHADDAVTGPNYAGAFHFRDGSGTQPDTEYTYDKNGNLTKDFYKNISSIRYNLLNLPSKTTFSDGGYINYQYSASGMKQMVSGYAPGQGYKSQFYLGSYVYSSGTVKQLLVDGGYVTFSGTTPQYHFYVKDHLGNNRMVVNASGMVEQVSHYYAFGGLIGENTGSDVQDFKYNGKELDRLHGLDWYDYSARHMDAARGVFTTMDPLAEKYYDVSPYAYCANNPMRFIDIKGFFPKGVLVLHRTSFYRADYYTFTKPAAHLLSLVTGVNESYIRSVNVMEKGVGREYPAYNPYNGGGAITIGDYPNNVTMTFTENYFADNANDYNGNGYGQNVVEWLDIASHEATHIKHVKQAGGKISYLFHFGKQYLKYRGHDKVPEEIEADDNRGNFRGFNKFVNKKYGNDSLSKLFNTGISDGQKIQQIDTWWEWKASEEKDEERKDSNN